jgi:arginase family enzyme
VSAVYALNPRAAVVQYGGTHYSYDSRVTESPLVEIPMRTIAKEEFAAVELLKTRGFLLEPRSADAIRAYLAESGFDESLSEHLIEQRFLEIHETHAQSMERRVLDYFNRRYLPSTEDRADRATLPYESADGARRSFSANTFFNLPRGIGPEPCHVGLLGVPIASVRASLGTITGPDHLRLHSRSLCWFDIHKDGLYSEISLEGARPEVICQGVVLRDCGDVNYEELTLPEVYENVRRILVTEFFDHDVYPIIVGGDHAITCLIVTQYLDRVPNLGVLHLDAHNDLFYTPRVVYSHAASISNLVMATNLQRIASFGLRTFTDKRMAGLRAVYKENGAEDRIRLRSLAATKRLIMHPRLLEDELNALADRPYYLTLDLDVLSEAAIGRQVSTPFGEGLEWHELLTFLEAVFRRLDIVGCDVVEFNGLNGDGRAQGAYLTTSLLLFVIDRLAKSNPKFATARAVLAAELDKGRVDGT